MNETQNSRAHETQHSTSQVQAHEPPHGASMATWADQFRHLRLASADDVRRMIAPDVPAPPRIWHFECPICEYDDIEHGSLALAAEMWCPRCFSDSLQVVRLRTWLASNPPPE